MQKYKGQSLAIVLVLLVVGSIIGFALYARMAREAERTVEEKASSEANELTETTIGLISTSEYGDLQGEEVLHFFGDDCSEREDLFEGCRRSGINLEQLENEFFNDVLGLDIDFSSFNLDFENYCFAEIAMRYGLEDDEVTIEQDDVYSIFFNKVRDWSPSGCSIDFFISDSSAADGFTMSTFYGDHDESSNYVLEKYKGYQESDILGFLYSGSGDNWEPGSDWTRKLSFPSAYPGIKDSYYLNEVRFKSLGGSSSLRWESENCDVDQFLIMEVGSTCGGKYIGKTFVVPSEAFAPPVFDYVLFNGHGELSPEPIPLDEIID